MLGDFSTLKLASAMARHANDGHAAIARNIAYVDVPNAKAVEMPSFADALKALLAGEEVRPTQTKQPITLDGEMVAMAQNGGRHTAAVTIWSETVELIRLAAQSPR